MTKYRVLRYDGSEEQMNKLMEERTIAVRDKWGTMQEMMVGTFTEFKDYVHRNVEVYNSKGESE